MGDISTWSPVDESNTAAPPNGWPENMQPSAVNNSARAIMGAVRRWYDTVATQLAGFLPLSGGTLTGHLNGTSIAAGGTITAATYVDTTIYRLTNVQFAARDSGSGGWHYIYDYSGTGLAIALGPANSIYRAASHVFQNKAGSANAGITTGTITATGGISAPSITATGTGMATTNLVASANITAGSYTTSSDSRIKQNIRPFGIGLSAIRQLNPVGFEYRETSPVAPGKTAYGLVADDVVDILPEMVGETAFDIAGTLTALKTLDQGHVPLVLINAVKELAARVEALEAGR